MKAVTIAAIAVAPALVLSAGGVTAAAILAPHERVQVVTRTRLVYKTRTVTQWKTRTVTRTVTVPAGISAACGQQLWQAWANRAPVAADMANIAPSTVPACVPYLSQIDGG